jgi:hypothetical protein
MSIRRRPAASIKGGVAQAKRWTDGRGQNQAAVRAWCQGATAAAPSARDGSHQERRTHAHVVQLQSINTLHIVYTYAPEQDQGRATMEKLTIPNGEHTV